MLLVVVAGVVPGLCTVAATALVLRDADVSPSVWTLVGGIEVYGWVTLMVWLLVVRRRNVTLFQIGLRRVSAGAIALMVPLTLAVFFVTGLVSELTRLLFEDVPTAEDQLGVASTRLSSLDLVCLLIATAVLAPVVEEIVFRGLLYPLVRQRRGRVVAVVVSALVFAVIHGFVLLWPGLFLFGVVLAVVFETSGSLYPAIVLHALNNALAVGLVYAA